MLTQDKIKEEFEKKFPCIDRNCDGHGNIPCQVGDNEWEAEQCQFHAEYLFPILAHLSAQYEKLIGECLPEEKIEICLPENHSDNGKTIFDWEGKDLFNKGFVSALRHIRTSLQERGIKIK